MVTKRIAGAAGLGLAAAAAVVLLILSFVGGGSTPASDGEVSTAGGSSADEALTLRYPARESGVSGDVYSLPWEELIQKAELVAIGVVGKQGEYERIDAGAPGLQGVAATYSIEVQRYVKGTGPDLLNLRKVVAHEYSGEESFIPEPYAYYIDHSSPLSVGGRYLLALIVSDDGWAEFVAEPSRFRLDAGQAVAESGMLDDAFLAERFPTKSEADLIGEIEALVAAQAAETAAR